MQDEMSLLKKDLEYARAKHPDNKQFKYKDTSVMSMWRVVYEYAVRKDQGKFMSYSQLMRWFDGTRQKSLERGWKDTLEIFHEEFGLQNDKEDIEENNDADGAGAGVNVGIVTDTNADADVDDDVHVDK